MTHTPIEEIMQAMQPILGSGDRTIIAIAGPPAAGKSTLAEALVERLNATSDTSAGLVPMDGYHFDNVILKERDLLERKGAPETFAIDAFLADMKAIRAGKRAVSIPVFDREADLARAHARMIDPDTKMIVVEGNYLLLDRPLWRDLRALFDFTIGLCVPEAELERRLIGRWLTHGLDRQGAETRTRQNDMRNALTVLRESLRADITVDCH